MARPRAPKPSAIACAIARILGMGASVVLLANLIYESVNWGKTLGLSITAAVIALVVDGSELMGLLDSTRTIPRVSPACVVCGDMLVLCLAIPSTFLIILSNYDGSTPVEPDPWESADTLSLDVTIALCVLRFLLLVWSCVDCCYSIRQPRRPEERMVHADSSSELRDV
ncbi:Aminopeptidase Y [Hypoxylon texense]